jgi:hypothetical protein
MRVVRTNRDPSKAKRRYPKRLTVDSLPGRYSVGDVERRHTVPIHQVRQPVRKPLTREAGSAAQQYSHARTTFSRHLKRLAKEKR